MHINLSKMSFRRKLFFSLVILTLLFIALNNLFDTRPFKFERFNSGVEAEEFFKRKYPIGSDAYLLVKYIEDGKGKCRLASVTEHSPNFYEHPYSKMYICWYDWNLFSTAPLIEFVIQIFVNHDDSMLDIGVSRKNIQLGT